MWLIAVEALVGGVGEHARIFYLIGYLFCFILIICGSLTSPTFFKDEPI
jgi:hypothetical protein